MGPSEAHRYPILEAWLKSVKACTDTKRKYRFHGASLLEGDVVGWIGARSTKRSNFVCEVKKYPLPIGSAGYGAIGQAIALKRFADRVYVGCIATGWEQAMQTGSTRALLTTLGISVAEGVLTWSEYLRVVELVFCKLFGELGLGLLVIVDSSDVEEAGVTEVVPAPRSGRLLALSNIRHWCKGRFRIGCAALAPEPRNRVVQSCSGRAAPVPESDQVFPSRE